MKKKIKNLSLISILLSILMCCSMILLPLHNNFKVMAEESTVYPKIVFSGYSENMDEDELHKKTRLPNQSSDAPSITILVHGQGGDASHFSNNLNDDETLLDSDEKGEFVYEQNSLLDYLIRKTNGDVNLYWAKFESESSRAFYLYTYDYVISKETSSSTYTVTDGDIDDQPSFSVDILLSSVYFQDVKNTTLDTIKIKVVFYMWEVNDGYQDIYLYNGNTEIWSTTINRSSGKDTASQRFEYTIELNINTYKNVDFMDLKFGAHGNFGDTWQFNNFEMTITITN